MMSNQPSALSENAEMGGEVASSQQQQQKKALKKVVKSVIPKLQNCSVNLSLFRKVAADELKDLIENVVGC